MSWLTLAEVQVGCSSYECMVEQETYVSNRRRQLSLGSAGYDGGGGDTITLDPL